MVDAGIRAVFFDAVGTLLFPSAPVARTYAEHAGRFGCTITEEQVRTGFRSAFAKQDELDRAAGWRTDEARERSRWQAIVADVLVGTAPDCFESLWGWFRRPAAWTVHPESGEVLRTLAARGFVVGMGSNFDSRLRPLVDGFPELAPVRDRCVISSVVGWRKPAREFFRALTEAADCKPGELLYVGDDMRNDFEGAMAAGLRPVLLDTTAEPGPSRIRRLRDLIAA
jgi:putative hydrolase of the HAD superfamily